MKALPTKNQTFMWCESCEQWRRTEDWSEISVYVHNSGDLVGDSDGSDGYYRFDSDCWHETTYSCDYCGCHDSSPSEMSQAWRCDECGEYHENKQDGDECCA